MANYCTFIHGFVRREKQGCPIYCIVGYLFKKSYISLKKCDRTSFLEKVEKHLGISIFLFTDSNIEFNESGIRKGIIWYINFSNHQKSWKRNFLVEKFPSKKNFKEILKKIL